MQTLRGAFRIGALAATGLALLGAGSATAARMPQAPAAAPASAVQPSGTPSYFAWVTLRDPSATVQPVAPYDQGNTFGSTNTVTYLGGGSYHVVFPLVGTSGGVVNVTVLGTNKRVCDVSEWDNNVPVAGSSSENVWIQCWNEAGTPAPATFTAVYTESVEIGGRLAYLWAGDWSRTDYTPNAFWNFNSTGTPNKIHRNGTGDYRVTLPGLASSHGNVQVGNYARSAPFSTAGGITVQTPTECNVASWGPHNAAMRVRVLCRDLHGHPINTQFQLTLTQGEGLKGPTGTNVAYLFANRPTTPSYTPAGAFRYSSPSGAPTIRRTATGRYTVSLTGMPKGGAAIVTAYGTGKVRCNLASINTAGHPEQMSVRCRDFSGHAVNAKFTLSYLR